MTKGSWWSNKHRKYKYQDKKVGLEYNLTLDQAKALMSLPCFYCCRPESKGLDRISNDFGHTTSNVVPCCGTCNLMLASTPWAAKIEMRESLRSIREKGLLGSWKPPYLTEPTKVVHPPLENEDAAESLKQSPKNGLCFWPHPDEMVSVSEEQQKLREEVGRKLRERLAEKNRRVAPNPPPRYDEVFHEGTAFLNSGEDCPPPPTNLKPVVLTEEEVRKLLEEGRECRKDLEKRIRKMHEFTPEMMNDKAKSASSPLRFHPLSSEECSKSILEELEQRGPMSPRDLETSFATHNQKCVRVAMQDLIDGGEIEFKNLQLHLTKVEEPIDPEGIQTC